jgi:sec-independent protein translocase protein TatA
MFGFGAPSGGEFLVVLIIALLLFGKDLPKVMQNIGKGVRQFQSGLKGMESEVNRATYSSNSYKSSTAESSSARPIPEEEDDEDDFDVPKFVPPTSAPVEDQAEDV